MSLESVLGAASQTGTAAPSGANLYTTGFFLVFIVLILVRRVYRGMHGARFSILRLIRIPVVYSIITAVSMIFLPLEDIFIASGIGIAGLAAGVFFGDTADFYNQGQNVFYRRAPIIITIWLVAFIARVVVELVYTSSSSFFGPAGDSTAAMVVDYLLAGSTGLMAGETVKIYRKYLAFTGGETGTNMPDTSGNL